MDITVELERSLYPTRGGNLTLAVQFAHGGASEKQPDLSIAAALDRSTSMRGAKLESLKAAARHLVQTLGPKDRLVLVAFDAGVEVLAAGPVVNKSDFMQAIERLEVRNGTNIGLALETAGRYLQGDHSGNVRRVLLLTDGEASVGELDRSALAKNSAELVLKEIGTTALGFGIGYDEDTLSAIAQAGAGRLHHVADPAKLPAVYASELGRMRALAARWIEVEVRPGPLGVVLGARNPYPQTRVSWGLRLECGDLRVGESKCVLFDVLVPKQPEGAEEYPVATVHVRWHDAENQVQEAIRPVLIKYVDDATAEKAEANAFVLVQVALLDAALAKERALEDNDTGHYASGSVRLVNTLMFLKSSPARGTDARLDAEIEKLGSLTARLGSGKLGAAERKEIRAEIHDAGTGTIRFALDVGDGPPVEP
jgi:Ca-activated chloride channel family protein